jgi:hypothetical protein
MDAVPPPVHQPKVQQLAVKAEPPKRRRKNKVTSDEKPDSSRASKSKSKAKHTDSNLQSNVVTKPGPSTLKHPPKGEDADVSETYGM